MYQTKFVHIFYIISVLSLILNQDYASAQTNLIPNPGFEEYYDCDYDVARDWLHTVIPHWSARNAMSHYYNTDCYGILYGPFTGTLGPRSGNGFLILWYDKREDNLPQNARMYAQVELLDTLKPGKNYYLEYYVQADPSSIPMTHYGIYFTDTIIYDRFADPNAIILVDPHLEVDSTYGNTDYYSRIHHCFHVDTTYHVMIAGWFRPRGVINPLLPAWHISAYVLTLYDDFYLIEVEDHIALKIGDLRDTICVGECVDISTNHSRIPGEFEWQLPGSDILTSQDSAVRVCYTQAGEYDIGIQLSHCHGEYSEWFDRVIVVVDAPPASPPDTMEHKIATGDTLRLTTCHEEWETKWMSSQGRIACNGCEFVEYISDTPIVDTVWSIVGYDLPCPDTCIHIVEVMPRVEALFTAENKEICLGHCFSIQNQSAHADGYVRYHLSGMADTIQVAGGDFTICPDGTGIFDLYLEVQNEVSRTSMILTGLHVLPFPELIVGIDTDIEVQYEEVFSIGTGLSGEYFLWSVQSGHFDIACVACPNTEVVPYQSGSLILTAGYAPCLDSLEYSIQVNRQEPLIYIPSGFSPNGDGVNDEFKPDGRYFTLIQLTIFDRFGSVLYSSSGEHASWDGTVNGTTLNPGVYVYMIEYSDLYGDTYFQAGDLTLWK